MRETDYWKWVGGGVIVLVVGKEYICGCWIIKNSDRGERKS